MENKNENIGKQTDIDDFDLESHSFFKASNEENLKIRVEKTGVMTTKYGIKKYVSNGSGILLLNKRMEQELYDKGYHNGIALIGLTLYIRSEPVKVNGEIKKTWKIEKIEK